MMAAIGDVKWKGAGREAPCAPFGACAPAAPGGARMCPIDNRCVRSPAVGEESLEGRPDL